MAISRPASLTVDGQRIVSDVPPVTQARDAFVPLRAVADGLGADMDYDAKTATVNLSRGDDVLRMHLGDTQATLNGRKLMLSHAPFEVRGRTMVGLGVIARAFGSHVRYDQTQRIATDDQTSSRPGARTRHMQLGSTDTLCIRDRHRRTLEGSCTRRRRPPFSPAVREVRLPRS